ncbi:MAG: hypothetical protein IJ848_01750 [Alphaproteobacteria bacterium]|nr:hypothetical protein [Alphaproteobacteria bacterium]
MHKSDFYTNSKEHNYEVQMLYWDWFKFIFHHIISNEKFMKAFLKALYEMDNEEHINLLNKLLKNINILSEIYFRKNAGEIAIKQ